MDVASRDDALARYIMRGYRAAGGDPGSDELLAFFCAVRALVRAKVDLLRAAQLDGAAAQQRAGRAHDRLALAETFAWRARLPRVVCVTGLPASGKTTIAEALAAAARLPALCSDRIRKLRAGVDPYEYAGAEAYSDARASPSTRNWPTGPPPPLARGGAIVEATFRRADEPPRSTPSTPMPPGSSARHRRTCCSRAPHNAAGRLALRRRPPDRRARTRAPQRPVPGTRTSDRPARHHPPVPLLLDALAATLDARLEDVMTRHDRNAPTRSLRSVIVERAIYREGGRTDAPERLDELFHACRADGGIAWLGLYRPSAEEFAAVARESSSCVPLGRRGCRPTPTSAPSSSATTTRCSSSCVPRATSTRPRAVEFGEVHVFAGPQCVITVRHGHAPDLARVRRSFETRPDLLQRRDGSRSCTPSSTASSTTMRRSWPGSRTTSTRSRTTSLTAARYVSRRIYELTREVIETSNAQNEEIS